jgi:hypothetical protein
MYTTWHTKNLFVAYNVEITSGAFKIRANNQWNDAKNYGLEVAGSINPNKYYKVITSGGSQNITPMEYGKYDIYFDLTNKRVALMTPGKAYAEAENGGNPIVVIAGLKDHEWGVVGSFNNWANDGVPPVVMTPMGMKHLWCTEVTFDTDGEAKFRNDSSWSANWGGDSFPYSTVKSGNNIPIKAGTYQVVFNDLDGNYYFFAK